MQDLIAGIDIGGTHVTACLVNVVSDEVISSSLSRIHIDPNQKKEIIIQIWSDLIRQCFGKAGVKPGRIGIAMPGPFDYDKGISLIRGLSKYEDLYGQNIKKLLSVNLGISSSAIRMMNDASAFLQGEMFCGAASSGKNLVGITLGTGLGSASYYNSSIIEGDLYRMEFRDSRAEDHACGRWLTSEYERLSGEKLDGVKAIAGRVPSSKEAATAFRRFGLNLGEILVRRYADQNPETIVIGGNIAKAWDYFIPATREILISNGKKWALVPAVLGEEAAMIGAAYLWK